MNKKGIFLAVDAVVAIATLVVGVILVLSIYLEPATTVQARSLSQSTMEYMISTTVDSINVPEVIQLNRQGVVDPTQTVIDNMGRLYQRDLEGEPGAYAQLYDLTSSATLEGAAVIEPFEIAVLLNETIIYNSSDATNIPIERSIISTRRVVIGLENQTVWGPFVAEVWVW